MVPDNCEFDIASAEGYWDFLDGKKVDFIFLRFLGWLAEWKAIFTSMYDNLEPGGWIEIQEWVINFESPDDSLQGTALSRWNDLIHRGKMSRLTDPRNEAEAVARIEKVGQDRLPRICL